MNGYDRIFHEWRSPVLRRGPAAKTNDGEGNVRGTGQYRLYVQLGWARRPRPYMLGLSWQSNGYIDALRAYGWQSSHLELGLGIRNVVVSFKFNDEPTVWDPKWMHWTVDRRRDRTEVAS